MALTIPSKLLVALFKALKGINNPAFSQTGQIQSRNYEYADLAACYEVAKPALFAEGLIVLQPVHEGWVHTILVHSPSGEMLDTRIQIPDVSDMQRLGSAITYLRRYGFCAMLSIVGQADDDGAGVGNAPPWGGPPAELPPPEELPDGLETPPDSGKVSFRDSVTELVKRIQIAQKGQGVRAFKKETEAIVGLVLRDFDGVEDLEGAMNADRPIQVAIYQRLLATTEANEKKAAEVADAG